MEAYWLVLRGPQAVVDRVLRPAPQQDRVLSEGSTCCGGGEVPGVNLHLSAALTDGEWLDFVLDLLNLRHW